MNISISDLTHLINNYEKCRELANSFGKIIVMKNKQPDSVLLPITEYEKLSNVSEKTENNNKTDIIDFVKSLPPAGNREVYTLAQLKYDLYHRDNSSFYSVGNRTSTMLIEKSKRDLEYLEKEGDGFIPTYTHTDVTDALYDVFGFRTDLELVPIKPMKKTVKMAKKGK